MQSLRGLVCQNAGMVPSPTAIEEYRALRATIRERGSLRVILALVSVGLWALLAATLQWTAARSLTWLLPLTVLGLGADIVGALHVGVERIGRYIQVEYEETDPLDSTGPHWEHVAMTPGASLPRGGLQPLFTGWFGCAALVNWLLAASSDALPVQALLLVAHGAVLLRLWWYRHFAQTQRQRDLQHFTRIRATRRGAPACNSDVPPTRSA